MPLASLSAPEGADDRRQCREHLRRTSKHHDDFSDGHFSSFCRPLGRDVGRSQPVVLLPAGQGRLRRCTGRCCTTAGVEASHLTRLATPANRALESRVPKRDRREESRSRNQMPLCDRMRSRSGLKNGPGTEPILSHSLTHSHFETKIIQQMQMHYVRCRGLKSISF